MELVRNELKQIVEECKRVARDNGLQFRDETLEFITTNEDMIKLSPKGMIPTLYDYWVNDIFVLQDKGKYELYPHNPYETVINTRPPISFYNDNNPDWLNVMIFYHVIAHIDFFQNNVFFRKTWLDDFLGRARAHAQVIEELRHENGRWVDYVIEFARAIDNIVDFYGQLNADPPKVSASSDQGRIDFFFDEYLQKVQKVSTFKFIEELEVLNDLNRKHGADTARTLFLIYVNKKYVDFSVKYEKRPKAAKAPATDVMMYISEFSDKLNKDENEWMKRVIQIVRETSLYFQPQIRTKILNEGWASYWHEKLFMMDPRMRTHEIEFSKINAGVVSMPRVGSNPYAIGLRLFKYLEAKADRGMISFDYEKLLDVQRRTKFDHQTGKGLEFIHNVRAFHSDFTALNAYIDQDFVNEFKLFVTGRRANRQKGVWEYYIKSRRAEDFKKQMIDDLYHPPSITIDDVHTRETGHLHLIHHFEGKELVREYIHNTMLGIEFLWGKKVVLETHEIDESRIPRDVQEDYDSKTDDGREVEMKFQKVIYTMEDRKLSKQTVD